MTSTAAIISSYEISNSQQEIMEVMIKSATANQSFGKLERVIARCILSLN
jgi:hypothetical protein